MGVDISHSYDSKSRYVSFREVIITQRRKVSPSITATYDTTTHIARVDVPLLSFVAKNNLSVGGVVSFWHFLKADSSNYASLSSLEVVYNMQEWTAGM